MLHLRNNTPFLMVVYVAGVRVGWIRPFRVEPFRGLKVGYHRLLARSEYGSAAWGPREVQVPGSVSLNLDSSAQTEDVNVALASRVYKANRSSLLACGKIAERRGEDVAGTRAEFEVTVNEKGEGQVAVKGDGLGESLVGCYRAVATQWKFPETGNAYTLSFVHVN